MKKSKVLTPHDAFVQKSLQRLEVAKDFLKQYLPESISKLIHWDTLSSSSEMLYGDNFSKRISDSILTAQMGEDIVYFYIEHLSGHKEICVEAYEKKSRLSERHRSIHKAKKIPLIYSIVLYHGNKEYTHSTNISDYLDVVPELPLEVRRDNLHSQLQLIDLSIIPDEQLRQHFLAGALQYSLKNIRATDIVAVLKQGFSSWLADLEAEHSDFVKDLVQYLIEAGQFNDPEELKQVIHQELPQTGEKMNNLIEYERQQGVQQGLQQGLQQVAKNMLEAGEPAEKITRMTGLSLEEIRSLDADK